MKMNKFLFTILLSASFIGMSYGEEVKGVNGKKKRSPMKALMENCAPATAETDLSINNVRARILGGGDMWWDLNNAKYEVPKGSDKHSMFSGALWLGGFDEADQLKLAAMTYRRRGNDYWPGPLSDDNTASVDAETCNQYDTHWLVYREEVALHKAWIDCKMREDCNVGEKFPGYEGSIPQDIIDWPGNGIDGSLPNKLAPYIEKHPDGIPGFYEYEYDYPGYDLDRQFDCQKKEVDLLYGDETIWWVYNDKGDVHTETQAGALGFEIRAQAFAFASNDEVNNMTFNNYRIINKSTFRLSDTYFGTWFDPDLGNARDDIIGCDISRGLGYCYNADSDDEGPQGYGLNPPAVGFDFFQGPFADYFDGLDNDRDGCVDGVRIGDSCHDENEVAGINERIIMSGFMYYNNGGSPGVPAETTDPDNAEEFYRYLTIRWKNGNPLVIENPSGLANVNGVNGDGYTVNGQGDVTQFAYPGASFDTTGNFEPKIQLPNGGWYESPANLADKRGLHTAGPFSLAPGALNFITTGVVWARNFSSNAIDASVNDVIIADDKAQQLFDNCFQILDGPRSPGVEIVALDKELIFKFTDAFSDATIGYSQKDPAIAALPGWTGTQIDSADQKKFFDYVFEGFQIFQVENEDVSIDQIYDTEFSRLVAQCDLKNNIDQLVNFNVNQTLLNGALEPQDMTVQAANEGIELSFRFTEDAFSEGDGKLINNNEYYYYVVAYSQNQWNITDPNNLSKPSQKEPYLAGRNIGNGQKPYLAIPNKVNPRENGTVINAQYGDEVQITRLNGAGNGGNFLKVSDETRNKIALNFLNKEVDYLPGSGPFKIQVVDPVNIFDGTFTLAFDEVNDTANWIITDDAGKFIAGSENPISFLGEQIVDTLGISVTFINQESPGGDEEGLYNNGVIGGEVIYEDERLQWLTGVQDLENTNPVNWILAGATFDDGGTRDPYDDYSGDLRGFYETFLNGTWAPSSYVSAEQYSAGQSVISPIRHPSSSLADVNLITRSANVDVVITKDQNLWTRCPVFELGAVAANNEGGKGPWTLRAGTTMDKGPNGTLVPNPNNSTPTGWSYFPGYAINVETGRRLYMAFGENSFFVGDNGRDMIWNPSANLSDGPENGFFKLGGQQPIYVFADSVKLRNSTVLDLTYQGDVIADFPLMTLMDGLDPAKVLLIQDFSRAFDWTSYAMVSSRVFEFSNYNLIPTDVRIELRIAHPYRKSQGALNDGNPIYQFNTTGLGAQKQNLSAAQAAMDLIRVVPNPYNGASEFEDSQLDNIVKITNLPPRCDINVYMTNGTLVRSISKDNTLTFVEWDLKNDFNVPIASGIYLVHINNPGVGEKVLKWMGTLRPVDLNAF